MEQSYSHQHRRKPSVPPPADQHHLHSIFNGQTSLPSRLVTSYNVNLGDGNDSETHITAFRRTVVLGNGNDTLFVAPNKIRPRPPIAPAAWAMTAESDF